MLRVFCVCVGERYEWDYVVKLASAFDRHLKIPFIFYCATDKSRMTLKVHVGTRTIRTLQPRRDCWGWWNLQEAYSDPWWAKGEQVLYTGLDTVITRDITDVIKDRCNKNRLTLHRDFTELLGEQGKSSMFYGSYADGITFIPRGGVPFLWDAFLEEVGAASEWPMHLFNTDKLKERNIVPDFWQDVAPGFVTSFKWPEPKTETPPEAVICFHGEPRPAQAAEEHSWIKEHWQ